MKIGEEEARIEKREARYKNQESGKKGYVIGMTKQVGYKEKINMSLRGGTTKQSHRVQYSSEEIATLRSQ